MRLWRVQPGGLRTLKGLCKKNMGGRGSYPQLSLAPRGYLSLFDEGTIGELW